MKNIISGSVSALVLALFLASCGGGSNIPSAPIASNPPATTTPTTPVPPVTPPTTPPVVVTPPTPPVPTVILAGDLVSPVVINNELMFKKSNLPDKKASELLKDTSGLCYNAQGCLATDASGVRRSKTWSAYFLVQFLNQGGLANVRIDGSNADLLIVSWNIGKLQIFPADFPEASLRGKPYVAAGINVGDANLAAFPVPDNTGTVTAQSLFSIRPVALPSNYRK